MLRRELALECDYQREAACARKFRCGSSLGSRALGPSPVAPSSGGQKGHQWAAHGGGVRASLILRGRRPWSGPGALAVSWPPCSRALHLAQSLVAGRHPGEVGGVGRIWARGLTSRPCQGAAEGPPLLLRARDRGRALQPPRADHRAGVRLPPGPGRGPEPGDPERGVSATGLGAPRRSLWA